MRAFFILWLVLSLAACSAPVASPVATSQASPSMVVIPAAPTVPTQAVTATSVPDAASAVTFTPTAPPAPAVIGLDNFSQLVLLHDYTPDLDAATNLTSPDYTPIESVYSLDSRNIAVALALPDDTRALVVLDAATGDLVSSIPLGDNVTEIYSMNFSPDGQKLIYSTYSTDNIARVSIWDLAAQKLERVQWSKLGYFAGNTAFSPDGKQIIAHVGNPDTKGVGNILMVWDATSGDLLQQLPMNAQYGVRISQFSADGRRLIISTESAGSQLTVYDTSTWQVLKRISPPNSAAEIAAISPDGTTVITSKQSGGDILVWDTDTGKQITSLPNQFGTTDQLEFSPNGSMLLATGQVSESASKSDSLISAVVWDTSSWKHVANQYWSQTISLSFAPNGKSLLALYNTSVDLIGLPDAEFATASQVVTDFTTALGKGDYAAAAGHFFLTDLETSNQKNQGLTTDPAAILETLCKRSAIRCLPATVIFSARYPADTRGSFGFYDFLVRYTKPDGSIFADAKGKTYFDIAVELDNTGNLKVFDLVPDYVAAYK